MPRVLLVAAAAALMFALPAAAQDTPANWKACDNGDKAVTTEEVKAVVTACTALIQSGTLGSEDLASAYEERGFAYENQKNSTRAIANYTDAIRLFPQNNDNALLAVIFVIRGKAYRQQKDHARAMTDFSEAIRLDPKYASAYYGRGLAETSLGRKANGAADIARAKAINPDIAKDFDN